MKPTTKTTVILSLLLLAIGLATFASFKVLRVPKIAYVRSNDLVYKYKGMSEAREAYATKTAAWDANTNRLKSDLQEAIEKYKSDFGKLSKEERAERENLLARQQLDFENYNRAASSKAKEEDEKITSGVLNQVNSFIEAYSKEQGYDIVIGTSGAGNLLYGNKTLDITDELLEKLNASYKKE